jgi:hypothetical protein
MSAKKRLSVKRGLPIEFDLFLHLGGALTLQSEQCLRLLQLIGKTRLNLSRDAHDIDFSPNVGYDGRISTRRTALTISPFFRAPFGN